MLRQRKENKEIVDYVKELDAFTKVEDDFQEKSSLGGTLSIIIFGTIITLVVLEFQNYLEKRIDYSYVVDYDHDSKLKFNVDITVAMPCGAVGGDVLDSTSSDMLTEAKLNEEDTWFEMSPNQLRHHNDITRTNEYLRNEYHSLHSLVWLAKYQQSQLPEREVIPDKPKDACRLYGTLELNKVAGNFHIIYGKSASFFGHHAHIVPLFGDVPLNFSHRIDHFSIGDKTAGIIYPLDSELKVTPNEKVMYQYFIEAVPTEIDLEDVRSDTYQYSVSEQIREVDHDKGQHGISGIFFKYDISYLKIKVKETQAYSLFEFCIRLVGIIGGIYATTVMIASIYRANKDLIDACRNYSQAIIAPAVKCGYSSESNNKTNETNPLIANMTNGISTTNQTQQPQNSLFNNQIDFDGNQHLPKTI